MGSSPTATKQQPDKKGAKNGGKVGQQRPKAVEYNPQDIRGSDSILGPDWSPVYTHKVDFSSSHFEKALSHLLQEPNINSTSIMRTDILSDELVDKEAIENWLKKRGQRSLNETDCHSPYDLLNVVEPTLNPVEPATMPLSHYLDDTKPRKVNAEIVSLEREIVRRLIPRNPLRDAVINQSCIILTNRVDEPKQGDDGESTKEDSILIVYLPHIQEPDEIPYYLPPVWAVGIFYHDYTLSVHYQLFDKDDEKKDATAVPFSEVDSTERIIRIAHHIGETAFKHSYGAKTGFRKRVHHDLVVPKVVFQDKYIELKSKYAKDLVAKWVEPTDPRKHVFEDLAIAAFVIELWNQMYSSKEEFHFVDVGCGNGLLANILISEGYKGWGIDAKRRQSWESFESNVASCLQEKAIVPKVLLDSNPDKIFKHPVLRDMRQYRSLSHDPYIHFGEFPEDAFIIGNHPDELTLWVPLFNRPFMVIPCCSHALSGAKLRFTPKTENQSTYAAYVDHVQEIAEKSGWEVEREVLRIPSTRCTAIIGRSKKSSGPTPLHTIIGDEGNAEGWVERTLGIKDKPIRNH